MELDLLKVGDKAPNFSLPDHNGDICNLSDYNKKKSYYVVFPKSKYPWMNNSRTRIP